MQLLKLFFKKNSEVLNNFSKVLSKKSMKLLSLIEFRNKNPKSLRKFFEVLKKKLKVLKKILKVSSIIFLSSFCFSA